MKQRIEKILDRIEKAATRCGRNPRDVRLVAVSKTMPAGKLKEAFDCGLALFGENYIQESREKYESLAQYPVSWHFIGHLQSNKAKYAVKMFDLIHSVDSLKLAGELNRQAKKIGKIQEILVQVNISLESTKSGIQEEELFDLAKEIVKMENLSLRGLMTMPPFFDRPEKVRPFFKALRETRDRLREEMPGLSPDELSMGMTGDFETAIEEGATLVRIGTAIFGKRN